MKLTDLNPKLYGTGGEGVRDADGSPVPRRDGMGILFDCPCGADGERVCIPFANPLDGGPQYGPTGWRRVGDTFETLTLTPSILRSDPDGCRWHGFITNGEVISV